MKSTPNQSLYASPRSVSFLFSTNTKVKMNYERMLYDIPEIFQTSGNEKGMYRSNLQPRRY